MSESTASESVKRSTPNYEETAEQRSLPELSDAFRPRYLFGWFFGFLERWFLSRSYRRLVVAMPFLVLVIGGAAFLWWLRSAPQEQLVRNYEKAVTQAIKDGDTEKASVYLESLVQRRPNDKRYRFQLALHLINNDQKAKGAAYLRELTEPGLNGFNPARLWLVQQATEDNPLIPLPPEAIEAQLRLIVDSDPRNATANRLLAERNLHSGKLKEAEDRLLSVAEFVPSLNLPLAKVQRLLNRSSKQVDFHLNSAADHFAQQLLKDPANVEVRIARSEALMLQGSAEDAERVLKEGLALSDDPKLRRSLGGLYAAIASQRIQESFLNRDLSAGLLVQAIALDPAAKDRLQQILILVASGAKVQPADLAPAIDALQNAEKLTNAEEVLLCQALAAAERFDEAIARLESIEMPDNQLQSLQARLYRLNGQSAKADELIARLAADYENHIDDLTPADTVAYADVLLLSSRFDDAVAVLKSAIAAHSQNATNDAAADSDEATVQQQQLENRQLQVAFGRACLAAYDQNLKENSFADVKQALTLLDEALQTNTVSVHVLDRLAHLVSSKHDFWQEADAALTKLLATGIGNVEIYNLLGTKALQLDDPERARVYLERAHSLSRSHPMVLNNLALALVRDDPGTAERALGLVAEVLEILPDHPDALSTRAEVLICMERWEEARRDLEVVLPKRTTSRNSRMLMARVYDALNEPALAEEHRRILKELEAKPESDDK
ncbi:MAG: hypothetical protein R3C59_24605 [Planctomycetaceae bacterium]